MEEITFEACICQIQKGEKEGLKQIYQAYVGLIYSVVYDMTGQREDAQDITMDVFIRLWERADTYRFGGKHKAWLITIARNMTIDFLRKHKRELPVEEVPEGEGEDMSLEVVGNLSFREAMERLKPGEREVMDLKILGGFTFQEISKVLKKPMGTVTWLYRQGLNRLRRYHGGQENKDKAKTAKGCQNSEEEVQE